MTKHLLQIHVGPLQEFIAAARRTRDLWLGSWLISEMSKSVARFIAEHEEQAKETLIFPAATFEQLKMKSEYNVTNKIVAVVSQNPRGVATKAEAALGDFLIQMREETFDQSLRGRELESWDIVKNQIDDLPEFYWVSVSFEKDEDYPQARQEAGALLAARKNCRNFEKVGNWGSDKPKSTLDGIRESVIPKRHYGDSKQMYRLYSARPAEQLSGVDLLKRLGKSGKIDDPDRAVKDRFPSTSHMAALPLTAQLRVKATERQWKAYWNKLPTEAKEHERIFHKLGLPNLGDADGSLLFASRLLDYFDKPESVGNGRSAQLKSVLTALQTFYKDTELEKPLPYYALLVGDGDFMGQAINRMRTAKEHRDFSKKLSEFAGKARKIVDSHQGAVVYAGGDDVMALLPLHKAIQCTAELAQTFAARMKVFQDEKGNSPTFSAGIAIAHHLEPLEDALKLARDAEKAAKSVKGKNALAVTLDKRSGVTRTVTGKWGVLDKQLLTFVDLYLKKELPHGLPYQLRDMFLHLGGKTTVKKETSLQEIAELEAGRIIKRKEGTERAVGCLTKAVGQLDHEDVTIESLSHELIIANLLAQAMALAGITPKKEETDDCLDS